MERGEWGHAELDVNVGTGGRGDPGARGERPFRLLIVGPLGGAGAGERPPIAKRRVWRVDRDEFDTVLARIAPRLRLQVTADAPPVELTIEELDDFHPDALYDRLPLFRSLREMRARLADARTFPAAAAELLGGAGERRKPEAPAAPRPRTGHVLDSILGGPLEEDAAAPAAPEDELQAMIRRIVAPHLVPAADPRQPEMLEQVDAAIAAQMRALLHHPDFQAVEALWRALWLMVRRVDTDAMLQLHIVDISREELAADLAAGDEATATQWHRLLVDASVGTPGAEPWSAVIAAFEVGSGDDELAMLERAMEIAHRAGAPFIAGAAPRLVGCPGFDRAPEVEHWAAESVAAFEALRGRADARYAGLVAPRFLLREPYGRDGESCERFHFEEMSGGAGHADFLWGSGALACGLLLAQSFSEMGWAMRPGARREIGGLPLYFERTGGEARAVPCAEVLLTERAAGRMMERGVMPLASLKDRDAVMLVRFQSIAAPLGALAGRWTTAGAE